MHEMIKVCQRDFPGTLITFLDIKRCWQFMNLVVLLVEYFMILWRNELKVSLIKVLTRLNVGRNGLVVKALDSHSRSPRFKTLVGSKVNSFFNPSEVNQSTRNSW